MLVLSGGVGWAATPLVVIAVELAAENSRVVALDMQKLESVDSGGVRGAAA